MMVAYETEVMFFEIQYWNTMYCSELKQCLISPPPLCLSVCQTHTHTHTHRVGQKKEEAEKERKIIKLLSLSKVNQSL
jgi:hypothetical protein